MTVQVFFSFFGAGGGAFFGTTGKLGKGAAGLTGDITAEYNEHFYIMNCAICLEKKTQTGVSMVLMNPDRDIEVE